MRIRSLNAAVLIATIVIAPGLLAQGGGQRPAGVRGEAVTTGKPAPKRDITGIWNREAGDPAMSASSSPPGAQPA